MRKTCLWFLLLIVTIGQAQDATPEAQWHPAIKMPVGEGASWFEWSPDGNYLIVRWNSSEYIYSAEGGAFLYEVSEVLEWSPDNSEALIKSAEDQRIYRLNLQTGEQYRSYPGKFKGRLAAALSENSLAILDTATDAIVDRLKDVDAFYVFSPDYTRILVERFGELAARDAFYIWTLGAGLSEPIYNVTHNHYYAYSDALWSPDGTILAVVTDDTWLRLLDGATGKLLHTMTYQSPLRIRQWHSSGRWLLVHGGDVHRPAKWFVWDVTTQQLMIDVLAEIVVEAEFVGEELFVPQWHSPMEFYDLHTGTVARKSPACGEVFGWARFPGRENLQGLYYHLTPEIQIIDSCNGEVFETLTGHLGDVQHVRWHPYEMIFASLDDAGYLFVWKFGVPQPSTARG